MKTSRQKSPGDPSSFVGSPTKFSAARDGHFHPKGKIPSKYTIQAQQEQRRVLPFSDRRDFEEAKRGFIAAPASTKITNDKGNVVWDIGRWDFLLHGKDFDSIHPSLQRQAILNMNYGLFEVVPGIYQIRGFDISNITFIQGKTGWIVIDTLMVEETARAAMELVNDKLGRRPVVAIIISHSHADHFGGIRGLADEADLLAGKLPVIAPKNFMYEAVSENLFGGNAMVRRKAYTYGDPLPKNPYGEVDDSIGKAMAMGQTSIIPPTKEIEKPFEELTIDGVRIVFQNTPNTEAPTEINAYFPDFKAFFAAENIVDGLHNILTLRGAPVRDALAWSKYINQALYMFGREAEVMFVAHTWPRWGQERIQEVMRGERDMYANLNNQVLHLANNGVTINQIHNVYEPPKTLQNQWYARGYHGSYQHDSRAVIQRYLGFWDANPATLVPLSPEESAPLYVELMGGAQRVMEKGIELYAQGKYRHAQEILNKLVYAEPKNQQAKDLLADTFEQLGYQNESPSLRNSYLTAALELRDGIGEQAPASSSTARAWCGIGTALSLDYLGILVDSRKAEGMNFKINLITPDSGDKFVIEMSNATLTSIAGFQAEDADLTLTIDRSDLQKIVFDNYKPSDLIEAGKAIANGNAHVLQKLISTLTRFDACFEIMPGTKQSAKSNPEG